VIYFLFFILCIVDEKNNFFHPKQEMGWRKRYCMEKKTDVLLCVVCVIDDVVG
jgi:hypothetical protein